MFGQGFDSGFRPPHYQNVMASSRRSERERTTHAFQWSCADDHRDFFCHVISPKLYKHPLNAPSGRRSVYCGWPFNVM
jgi:hypothetical protein